jgi:hypothetical protein
MTLKNFIRENQEVIDDRIRYVIDDPFAKIDNADRAEWVANDERLYLWALEEGVKI